MSKQFITYNNIPIEGKQPTFAIDQLNDSLTASGLKTKISFDDLSIEQQNLPFYIKYILPSNSPPLLSFDGNMTTFLNQVEENNFETFIDDNGEIIIDEEQRELLLKTYESVVNNLTIIPQVEISSSVTPAGNLHTYYDLGDERFNENSAPNRVKITHDYVLNQKKGKPFF